MVLSASAPSGPARPREGDDDGGQQPQRLYQAVVLLATRAGVDYVIGDVLDEHALAGAERPGHGMGLVGRIDRRRCELEELVADGHGGRSRDLLDLAPVVGEVDDAAVGDARRDDPGQVLQHLVELERRGEHSARLGEQRQPPLGRLRLLPGLALRVDERLVEPPCHEAGDARARNEERVDGRPAPRVVVGGVVIEDRVLVERADHAVVDEDVGDRREERKPVLVQRDYRDHDEEVEVHLDHAAREVYQHRGSREQAK